MSKWIKRLIESKRAYRAKLAALPLSEKLQLLGKLRQRTLLMRNERNASPASAPRQRLSGSEKQKLP